MQKYKVTLILTAEEFMDLVPHLGLISSPKIEKVIDKTGLDTGVELDPSAMRGRGQVVRTKRKSKVIEIILDMVGHGHASASDLRGALSRAGMSESSLSTGLSILQKSGQIKRGDNGEYYLSVREAA
jgi:hypothetical protein